MIKDLKYRSGGCFNGNTNKRHQTRRIDSYELIIVRSGHLPFFEDADNYDIHENQFLLLEPGREHGSSEDYPQNLSFYWLHFYLPRNSSISIKTGHFIRSAVAADICSRLLDEQNRNDAPKGACDLLMQLLLLECEVVQDLEQHDPSGLVDKALKFIKKHYQDAISTSDIAKHCDCNPDHLGRIFKSRVKSTVSHAILSERLQHARSLLRDTDSSIEVIAHASGFSEAHYFRRCFKHDTGLSPSKWRSLHCRRYYN